MDFQKPERKCGALAMWGRMHPFELELLVLLLIHWNYALSLILLGLPLPVLLRLVHV